jgi:hypothetical protein
VTTPVLDTVANDGLLLLQVPPAVASLNAAVNPTHTLDGPVIAAIGPPTVITDVTEQDEEVYVIVVVPGVVP